MQFVMQKIPGERNLFTCCAVVILVLLCIFTFYRSLFCFFFADDFLCFDYIYKIFHGQPEFFLKRLISPWQDHNIQLFYRPVGDVSLSLDYLVWQSNAFGYHLTNLVLHIVAVLLFYCLSVELLAVFEKPQAGWAAFFAALLFAVYPLHNEAIFWIVGRLDLLCTIFYFGAFLFFILGNKKTSGFQGFFQAASFVCYLLSLLTKEMSVSLPVVLGTYVLFFEKKEMSWLKRLKYVFVKTWIYYAITIAYLLVRGMILGTLFGGYTGSFGQSLEKSTLARCTDFSSFWRIFYPLNSELFQPESLEDSCLHALYVLVGVFLILRVSFCLWKKQALGLLAFCLFWTALSLLPALPVFFVSTTLVGGRVFYLPSAALSLSFVLLFYPCRRHGTGRLLNRAAGTVLVAFAGCFSWISYAGSLPWEETSTLLLNLKACLADKLAQAPREKKVALLNLPAENKGAHGLYEFSELKTLMGPAFCLQDYSKQVACINWFPGFSNYNMARLQRLWHQNSLVYWFDANKLSLIPEDGLSEDAVRTGGQKINWKQLKPVCEGEKLVYLGLFCPPVSPFGAEVLNLFLQSCPPPAVNFLARKDLMNVSIDYTTNFSSLCLTKILYADGMSRVYSIPFAEVLHLNHRKKISRIILYLPDGCSLYQFSGSKISAQADTAVLYAEPESISEGTDGLCRFNNNTSGKIFFDVSKISGSHAALVEISQPANMFDFGWQAGREAGREARVSPGAFKTMFIPGIKGSFVLSKDDFRQTARYQIRLCAISCDHKLAGNFSYPLTLDIKK